MKCIFKICRLAFLTLAKIFSSPRRWQACRRSQVAWVQPRAACDLGAAVSGEVVHLVSVAAREAVILSLDQQNIDLQYRRCSLCSAGAALGTALATQ